VKEFGDPVIDKLSGALGHRLSATHREHVSSAGNRDKFESKSLTFIHLIFSKRVSTPKPLANILSHQVLFRNRENCAVRTGRY
jgi:hypothetical protein